MLIICVYIPICIYNVIFNKYFIYIFIEYKSPNCFLNFKKKTFLSLYSIIIFIKMIL